MKKLTVLFFACLISFSSILQAKTADNLSQSALFRIKPDKSLTVNVENFLKNRNSETATVWIHFTDKGFYDKAGFDKVASKIILSEKVKTRRSKENIQGVLFLDIPIKADYIEKIIESGGKLRRESKWLNAASFEIEITKLKSIEQMPFVYKIEPVAFFKRNIPIIPNNSETDDDYIKSSNSLDYGNSYAQVNQINVISAHNKGFSGAGVTLAIFDTGFRKSHEAFAYHYNHNRVLAEYDFIFNDSNVSNEPEDASDSWNHGTSTWGTSAGFMPGNLIGPAYNANIILCKTEDVRSETVVEEDNWVAAAEWVEQLGADVISSSLGYTDWYTYEDFDGETALTTIAANTAASLGIIVCNSMGNSGPSSGSLGAPADAFEILSVGAVSSAGLITSFSSRGPTYDGRIKPEVVARGLSDYVSDAYSDFSYGTSSGTSFSCPLVAGVTCLAIEAHPTFPSSLIRTLIMETADNSDAPNNTYGWGLVDAAAAVEWGAKFTADTTFGDPPITVQFYDSSSIPASSWQWDFGDGNTSTLQNPVHTYTYSGAFNVSLTIETAYGPLVSTQNGFVIAPGDTLRFISDSVYAGEQAVMSVELNNSMNFNRIIIPFEFDATIDMVLDSVGFGSRTEYFEDKKFLTNDPSNNSYTIALQADNGGGAPLLPPGNGEIAKLFFSIAALELGDKTSSVDSTQNYVYNLKLESEFAEFTPEFHNGTISSKYVLRGDANLSGQIGIGDLTYLVNFFFLLGPKPIAFQAGDVTADLVISMPDITYLVDYLFQNGPAPPTP